MEFIIYYFVIAFIFLCINSIISGYQGETYSLGDAKDSILWPFAISVLIGLFTRVVHQKVSEYIDNKKTKSKGK